MDFFQIKERSTKGGTIEVYPDFRVIRSKDFMVRAKSFYAIWDEERGLWSTDEYDVQRLVDKELMDHRNRLAEKTEGSVRVKLMSEFSTNAWTQFRSYLAHLSDNSKQLDVSLTFQNSKITKKDYVSRRLPYSLEQGEIDAYNELLSTLYSSEERAKLEWAIGAIISGDAKDIQKFLVLYGEGGTGKSTVLNIIQKLFVGYYTTFEAKALTSSSNGFSTEVFRNNPLVAIQHDGDLSRIEDNTKLNSIVSHEEMTMNEKYKPSYTARANCFLFMATNKPVKITDAKSGIIRRLIDVRPTGNKIPTAKYHALMQRIDFELGAIAYHCLKVYESMGKNYYSSYRPMGMILETDVFYNFMEDNYFLFKEQGGVSLSQAYALYKTYCDETLIEFKLPRHKFREELRNYFDKFSEMARIDGRQVRSWFSELKQDKFDSSKKEDQKQDPGWIVLDASTSIFDTVGNEFPAQLASIKSEVPKKPWSEVTTKLGDIQTTKLHYVKLPSSHIVIDFDLKGPDGNKSAELNLEAANKWPPTYAEYSKSEKGIHLHYIYEGDTSKLARLYSEGIEVKVFTGDASLRRKLTKCNKIEISTIKSGLPLKEEKKVINFEGVKSEKAIRDLIKRNLNKEIHSATKPSIDFIYTILEEAYASGLHYDVSDLRNKVLVFAINSSNNSDYCLDAVGKMHFKSEEPSPDIGAYTDERIAFFDVEVFPNLFVVCWKYAGEPKCQHMVNPTAQEIENLMRMKLVGFNCRRYDNHILYARYIGYDIPQLFKLSDKIIKDNRSVLFGEAYNISYADVYDFSSVKQSLKKFEIELGIHHQELGIPFDQEIPESKWPLVVEYCDNDVIATEAVFNARREDFTARQILSELSGLTVNDTTQNHTAKIIFGNDQRPQDKFVYTNLSDMFPGYKFELGKSYYRGEQTGEGGYVYAEPGFYTDVALLDVASMHPTSIELLNLFGPYTSKFSEIKAARIAIKHKDFDKAKTMLGGILERYLTSKEQADALAYALKIVINIVYGLTSAKFSNKFRDPRNIDNIVAKRGALFMIDLKRAVQDKGFVVAHVKTDSIKIPNATPEIIEFVIDFGKKYGYEFEHEATYNKMCLVNDAVYIAQYQDGHWTAVGAEFAHPYVFKTLFSKEEIEFSDLCETKSVTSALYLDMNEGCEDEHHYQFVGRAGSFCPMRSGAGGGLLLREKEGKYSFATGAKGFRWLEAEVVKNLSKEDDIDISYFEEVVNKAVKHLSEFAPIEKLLS